PVIAFGHVRADQRGCGLGVVRRADHVADVVNESADDGFLVLTGAMSARGGLKAVPEAGHLITAVGVHGAQPAQYSLGELGQLGILVLSEKPVVVGGAIVHGGEPHGPNAVHTVTSAASSGCCAASGLCSPRSTRRRASRSSNSM